MSDQPDAPESHTRRRGRARYTPTARERLQVKTMAGLGLTHEGISVVLGISAPTLRKHFRHELNVGAEEANAQVAASLFRQATHPVKPNTVAAIFWLKCRAHWRDHDATSDAPGKKQQQYDHATSYVAEGRRFAPGSAPPALKLVK